MGGREIKPNEDRNGDFILDTVNEVNYKIILIINIKSVKFCKLSIRARLPAVPKCYIIQSPEMNAFATGLTQKRSSVTVTSSKLLIFYCYIILNFRKFFRLS